MPSTIRDGKGKGFLAEVNSAGQLKTISEVHSIQHHVSRIHSLVFQTLDTYASVGNTTQTILHLKNDNSDKTMVVTFVRMQAVNLAGGTALPSINTYFQIGFGETYTSGGTALTPINMDNSSGNASSVTVYGDAPTVGGTFTEFDRWYIESDSKMITFDKQGSVLLGKNNTMSIRLVTDHTSGTAYARVTFLLMGDR